ncbi:MAG: hypothetical protein M5U27_07520 [Gaiella sp.]|nr:hypothetical protein [Gaiella sp.]
MTPERDAHTLLWEAFPEPASEPHKSWDNVLDRAGVKRVALYDAVQGTDRAHTNGPDPIRPRRARVSRVRPRSVQVRVLSLAVAAAAVAAAVLLWSGTDQTSILDRARAALAGGPVLHLVLQDEAAGELVDLASGTTTTIHAEREIWYEPQRGLRERSTFGGAVQSDVVRTPDRLATHEDAFLRGFLTRYRSALQSGTATAVGEGTLEGTPVTWLQIDAQSLPDVADQRDHLWAQEVAVARDSGIPVYLRETRDGEPGPDTGAAVLSFETLPTGAVDLAPRPEPTPTAVRIGAEGTITAREANALLGGHAVSLGDEFAGLSLALIQQMSYASGYDQATGLWQHETRGARFFYGSTRDGIPDFSAPYLSLSETTELFPGVVFGPRGYVPPPGTVLLQTERRGILRLRGIYVTIEASAKETVITAARALREVR